MKYLTDNNLLDKGHSGEIADRSYSVLQETESGYEKLAYVRAFPEEIFAIISALENFISALEKHEDTIYHQKAEHISYLRALIVAFSEQNTDALVEKWANVDREWMKLTNPFQIVHPLEFYEDMYRKAVAPEWEFRIQDTTLFTSKVSKNIIPMFEKLCEKLEVSKDSKMREFSLGNIQKVQLHIASPVFYYGARFNGLPSAQIVPNDEVVSKLHGKKIFSFAADVLA